MVCLYSTGSERCLIPAVVATLSSPGGGTLRTFDATTGDLLLEKRLHAPNEGALSEPAHYGKDVAFAPNSDGLYVITNGCTITHINGTTGEVIWTHTSEDRGCVSFFGSSNLSYRIFCSSMVISSKLILTNGALYAVGVGRSVASYTLHITTFSPTTGEVIADSNIVSSIIDPLTEFITLSSSDPEKPVALWLEQGTLRHLALTPVLKEKPRLLKGLGFAQIVDIGLNGCGHAVIARNDGSSFVIKIDEESGYPKSVWEYKDSVRLLQLLLYAADLAPKAKSDANADSIYAGAIDALGQPYVTRVFWSHQMKVRSIARKLFVFCMVADRTSRKALLTYLPAIWLRDRD